MSDPVNTILQAMREAAPDAEPATQLATVTGGGADQVGVRFDGETIASARAYKRFADYYPVVGDRVLMVRSGTTWVVAGKVGQGLDRYETAINVPNMQQTLLEGRTQRSGNAVDLQWTWQVTAAVGAGVDFWFNLPYEHSSPVPAEPVVIGNVTARRTGVTWATGSVVLRSSTTARFMTNGTIWNGNTPQTWTSPDLFTIAVRYFAKD